MKLDEPLTVKPFDNSSNNFKKAARLSDKLYSYDYYRRNLEALDSKENVGKWYHIRIIGERKRNPF